MNAYELADEIDSIAFDWLGKTTSGKLANMLRQQADRIAELEHMNKNWQLSETMAYNRIAELEKDLAKYDRLAWDDLNKQSSEPYCWRMKANDPNDKDWWLFGRNPNRDEKVSHSAIPLYTTPQIKELSDEEIYELWCEADNTELLPEMRNKDGSINYIILTFAELLLEKASKE